MDFDCGIAKEGMMMRTLSVQIIMLIGLVLSAIGTQSCAGQSKDSTADTILEVSPEAVSDLATDDQEGNAPDVIGDLSAESISDVGPVDAVDTGLVPCPEGELTLEHINKMSMTWCEKVGLGPGGHCGNADDDKSPQCFCAWYGDYQLPNSPPSPTGYRWECHESWPYVQDAY